MANYWQIIRTDEYGRISGETYSDPFNPPHLQIPECFIDRIIHCFINSHFMLLDVILLRYPELFLKPFGSTVCKFPSDKTNYAVISKSTMCGGEIIVEFDHRELKDMEELIEARKIQKGYTGRYYTDIDSLHKNQVNLILSKKWTKGFLIFPQNQALKPNNLIETKARIR